LETALNSIAVVPRFSDLFGRRPTLGELLEIVRRFNCLEWLSYLSRVSTTLGPLYELNPDRQAAVFYGIIGSKVRAAIENLAKRDGRARVLLAAEAQVATLQQLVVLKAPVAQGLRFEKDEDFDQFGYALLMTMDLMEKEPSPLGSDQVTASLAQAYLRRPFASGGVVAARACAVYELLSDQKSESTAKLAEWFQAATGVPLEG